MCRIGSTCSVRQGNRKQARGSKQGGSKQEVSVGPGPENCQRRHPDLNNALALWHWHYLRRFDKTYPYAGTHSCANLTYTHIHSRISTDWRFAHHLQRSNLTPTFTLVSNFEHLCFHECISQSHYLPTTSSNTGKPSPIHDAVYLSGAGNGTFAFSSQRVSLPVTPCFSRFISFLMSRVWEQISAAIPFRMEDQFTT